MPSGLRTPWCAALAMALLAAASALGEEVFSVDLTFDPPTAQHNTLQLTLSVTALGTPKSDTETTQVTGNALVSVTASYNHASQMATVTGLEFTGGAYSFSPVHFDLNYGLFVGHLYADATGVGGTLDTPNPPGSVTDEAFPGSEHEAIVNRGTVHAWGTALVGAAFDETTIDLSQTPIAATSTHDGTLRVSAPTLANGQATYAVTMEMPVAIDELIYDDGSASASIAGSGTFRATGQFTRAVPMLGDLNGDGLVDVVDVDTLFAHLPSAEPEYDVNGDGSVTGADADVLVRDLLGSQYGDADLNGCVDHLDYLTVKAALAGMGSPGWAGGDFNGDLHVDGADLDILAAHFGWFAAPAAPPAALPEPATLVLLAALAPMIRPRRVRGSRREWPQMDADQRG